MFSCKRLVVGMACGLAMAASSLHAGVSFQGLGYLDSAEYWATSWATGVSADGSTVVGWSYVRWNESTTGKQPFHWTQQTGMTQISGPDLGSDARAVSANGVAVAGTKYVSGGAQQAYRWTATGGTQALGILPGDGTAGASNSYGYGISYDGSVVVGCSERAWQGKTVQEAFRWTPSTGIEGLASVDPMYSCAYGVSADGTVIVGQASTPDGRNGPFRWTAAGGMEILQSSDGLLNGKTAYAVSADGSTIVGTGFKWNRSTGPVALAATATAVAGDGSTLAGYGSRDMHSEAVYWDATGMHYLSDVLRAGGLDLSNWTLEQATGISADGRTIVGFGMHPSGYREAWVAVVPEPTTILPIAVVLMGMLRRQRRSLRCSSR